MASVDYDSELQRFNEVLRRRYGIRPGDHVLDVGCGTGQTTRDAARMAAAGSATGVDVSAPMIERARQAAQGLHDVAFEQGDAARQDFDSARFDVVISRFGTMFFAKPIAAFTNLARATRPDGRLVMLVWQARERNEWAVAIRQALADDAAPSAGAPDAFSLGDPATVTRILEAAGFGDVAFDDVHEPVYYGPDVAAAMAWVGGFSTVSEVLRRLDPASADAARTRLEQMLTAHARADGVWLDARAWLVTARRRAG